VRSRLASVLRDTTLARCRGGASAPPACAVIQSRSLHASPSCPAVAGVLLWPPITPHRALVPVPSLQAPLIVPYQLFSGSSTLLKKGILTHTHTPFLLVVAAALHCTIANNVGIH
jgi:hypothetical protein